MSEDSVDVPQVAQTWVADTWRFLKNPQGAMMPTESADGHKVVEAAPPGARVIALRDAAFQLAVVQAATARVVEALLALDKACVAWTESRTEMRAAALRDAAVRLASLWAAEVSAHSSFEPLALRRKAFGVEG